MIVKLEIKNEIADSLLKVLKQVKGVTIKSLNDKKIAHLLELREAYHQTELAEKGEIELKTFDELINEL
jgi:hypothetical protein